MTAALLYRQDQRWQIWAAFCGAVLLHLCAVALAQNEPALLPPPMVEPEIMLEIAERSEPSTPPQIEEDPLPLPPPPVAEEVVIAEENPPAPIRKRSERPVQPLVRQTVTHLASSASMTAAKVLAVVAPRPEYPYEARRQRTTGSGVAVLSIDPASGRVVEVAMLRSTGSAVLDNATISGFRRWRFKAGTVSRVQSPITYTLTGASY